MNFASGCCERSRRKSANMPRASPCSASQRSSLRRAPFPSAMKRSTAAALKERAARQRLRNGPEPVNESVYTWQMQKSATRSRSKGPMRPSRATTHPSTARRAAAPPGKRNPASRVRRTRWEKSRMAHLLFTAVSIAVDHLSHLQLGQKQPALDRLDIGGPERAVAESYLHDLFELIAGLLQQQRLAVDGVQPRERPQDVVVVKLGIVVEPHAVTAHLRRVLGIVAGDMLRVQVVRGAERRTPLVQVVDQAFTADEDPILKGLLRVVGVDVAEQVGQALVVVLLDMLPAVGKPYGHLVYEVAVGHDQLLEKKSPLPDRLFGVDIGRRGWLRFHSLADLSVDNSSCGICQLMVSVNLESMPARRAARCAG
nr:MAG TPA: hypothetical protein [Caudoviricetes sp.]